MTNKAYIVVNKQQEHEVLEQLEREGMVWGIINEKPTENKPSNWFKISIFPYIIFVDKNTITWDFISELEDEEIVFDGRKEEQMSEKYVVSQEFMNKLEDWKSDLKVNGRYYIYEDDIYDLPSVIENWWKNSRGYDKEANNRLIAIIRWVNGEDVFEVEKPKKWVVRSKIKDEKGGYWFVHVNRDNRELANTTYRASNATKFDTKEEAESWANDHQEVVEVE